MAEPRSYTLSLSRIEIAVHEWGDPAAPPLILQHGGRDHARSWDWVARAFADRRRVIVPDLRGHGDSDWTNDGSYELIDFVEDFVGLVRALDLPPCEVVGHSLGGNIVTRFAGLYPERVTRLVNIEGLGDSPQRAAHLAALDQAQRLRDWIDYRAAATLRQPRDFPDREALIARMSKTDGRLSRDTVEHLATHAARVNPDGTVRIKHDPTLGNASPIDIGGEVKMALWAAITCPVLLVYGAESWASDPAADGRAGHFRDVRVELFAGAGHWVHHDRRDDFIALLGAFLA